MQNQDIKQQTLESNEKIINDEFEKIHRLFQCIEKDLVDHLETKQQENQQIYETIKCTLEQDDQIINRILENHKNAIESYTVESVFNADNKMHIGIIKDNEEAKQLIQKKLNQEFGEYQQHSVEFNQDKINEILELVKKSITLKSLDDVDNNDDNDTDFDQEMDEGGLIEALTMQQFDNDNQFISSPLSTITSKYKSDQDIVNAPIEWYSQLLNGESVIEIFNKTNLDLDYHIYGSTNQFKIKLEDIKEKERPQFYTTLVSVRSQNQVSVQPVSKEVDIIVTYTNDKKEVVKVLSRKSNASDSFTVLQSHLCADVVTTLTLAQFNDELLKLYPNCYLIPESTVIKRNNQNNNKYQQL